jgi:hypothetical protein
LIIWLDPFSKNRLLLDKLSLHFEFLNFFELDVNRMFSLSSIKLKVEHSFFFLAFVNIVKDATVEATLREEAGVAIHFLTGVRRILGESFQTGKGFPVDDQVCLFTVRKVT